MDKTWTVRLRVGLYETPIREQWIEERVVYGAKNRDDAIALAADQARSPYVHGCDYCEVTDG